MNSLVGKFIFWDDEEYMHYGQVTEHLVEDLFLLKPESCDCAGPHPKRVISLLASHQSMMVFDTRKEFDDWLAWLETPSDKSKPKIVSINSKPKNKDLQ